MGMRGGWGFFAGVGVGSRIFIFGRSKVVFCIVFLVLVFWRLVIFFVLGVSLIF